MTDTPAPDVLAVALVTACHVKDFPSMAAMLNDVALKDIGPVMASLSGLASAMLDYLAVYMEIEPAELLHRFGIETAQG